MRGVVVVVLASLACALLCEGQGSGDVIVITPTSKAAPPTDATNDSGSGDDDEDFNNGSGSKPTRISTVRPTPDSDDEGSGGSGSGFSTVTTMPKRVDSTMATTGNTDIYISEGTTAKVITAPTTDGKTTQITDSVDPSTASLTASIVNVVTTETPIQATEKKTTQAVVRETTQVLVRDTTQALVGTTSQGPKTTVEPTTEQKNEPTEPSQTTKDPNVLYKKRDEPEEGFTLTTEVIAGVVGCALLALLLIAFLMYRLKKRDEGSYLLDDPHDKKMGNSDKEAFV